MNSQSAPIQRAQELLSELSKIVEGLSDEDVARALGAGHLDELFRAILDPEEVQDYDSIADFFLANKHRASLLATVRLAIHKNYSFKVDLEEGTGYASPARTQWFEDGVILLEGSDRFEGLIVHYVDGKLRYGVAGRKIEEGEEIGPEDFEWISEQEVREQIEAKAEQGGPSVSEEIETAIERLDNLISEEANQESEYQELLDDHSSAWLLEYTELQSHPTLDDENIPDFTGTRARDGKLDIIEIKPPFLPLFDKDGEFRAEFHNAWQQAEDRLTYVRRNRRYLADQKNMEFEDPHCYLILGHDLSPEQRRKIRKKEENYGSITVLTYDELRTTMSHTLDLVQTV